MELLLFTGRKLKKWMKSLFRFIFLEFKNILLTRIFVFSYLYEIVVFLGYGISNTSEPIFAHTAKKPPFLINPENLGADSPGKVYTVGIRVKSDKVIISHLFYIREEILNNSLFILGFLF